MISVTEDKMKIKRIMAAILVAVLCVLCAGCGEEKPISYNINFKDGESFTYSGRNLQDEYLGDITYTYADSGNNWVITGVFDSENGQIEYSVTAKKGDLQPVSSYRQGYPKDKTEQPEWYYKAAYSEGSAAVEYQNGEEKQVTDVSISGRRFDAECLPMVLRGFDLKEDFSTGFYFVNTYTGTAVETSAEVTGMEEINGRQCYKLYLSTVEIIPNPMMTIYYTADEDKIPLRIEQKSSTFDLTEQR